MKRIVRRMAYAIIALALISGLIVVLAIARQRNNAKRETEAVARLMQQLPIGCQRAQVVSYLTSHHIEYGYTTDKSVVAILRDVDGYLVKRSIQIEFCFDNNNTLIKKREKDAFTGP